MEVGEAPSKRLSIRSAWSALLTGWKARTGARRSPPGLPLIYDALQGWTCKELKFAQWRNVYYAIGFAAANWPAATSPSATTAVGRGPRGETHKGPYMDQKKEHKRSTSPQQSSDSLKASLLQVFCAWASYFFHRYGAGRG